MSVSTSSNQHDEGAPGADAGALMAVVIVSYNTCELLRACLLTVIAAKPHQVIVVDNASTDDSAAMVRTEFPQIILIENTINHGYGAAANQGIDCCTSPYVLLLNSDTLLEPDALTQLSRYFMQHSHAAIVGPRLVHEDGTLQRSCFPFPSPGAVWFGESFLSVVLSAVPLLHDCYLPTWSHHVARQVPWVLGAALAIRRDVFAAIGGFDESFFMYFEEVDLCYRLWQFGWQIHFAPVTNVMHIREASSHGERVRLGVELYHSLRQFTEYHYARRQQRQLRCLLAVLMVRNIVRDWIKLRYITDPTQRSRLREDCAIWQRVLAAQWREPNRLTQASHGYVGTSKACHERAADAGRA